MTWYVYIVECSDGSYYTGITTDITRRLAQHNTGKGAKYTRSRKPVTLLASVEVPDRSSALKLEARVKKMKKDKKQETLWIGGKPSEAQ